MSHQNIWENSWNRGIWTKPFDALDTLLTLRTELGELPQRLLSAYEIQPKDILEGEGEGWKVPGEGDTVVNKKSTVEEELCDEFFYDFVIPDSYRSFGHDKRELYEWSMLLKSMLKWEPAERLKCYDALKSKVFEGV